MAIGDIISTAMVLDRQTGGAITATAVERLCVISRRLNRLDAENCNQGSTERREAAIDRLEKEAEEIAARYGATARHGRDPRGWALHIVWTGARAYDAAIPV